jgi:hypothetical protein
MVYEINYTQLLALSTVNRLLGEAREMSNAMDRSEILTKAQIILTAFILGLEPWSEAQTNTVAVEPLVSKTPRLDV